MAIKNQVLHTAIISFVCTTVGILYSLPSSTVEIFSSENTPLDRVMTHTEISFMGSLSNASAFLITPIAWYLLNKIGRKRSLILFHLPQLLAWIILVTMHKVEAVLFAMFISGFSGTCFLIIPIFVSEYCEISIRGAMISGSIVFYEFGIMVSYLFGGFLEYKTINYISLTISVLGLCMACCMRESPLYLIKKGLEDGIEKKSGEVSREIEYIRRILNFDLQNTEKLEKQSLKRDETPSENLSFWKILAKSPTTRCVMIKLLFVQTVSIFQGVVVVQVYAQPLLKVAVPSMTPTVAAVLCALVIALSSLIGAYLVDIVGRRPLFISTATANVLCCVIIGTQVQFDWGPNWLNAVFMNLYFCFYILGPGTIPHVLAGELFLPKIKMFTTAVVVEWAFLCNFTLLSIFHPIERTLAYYYINYDYSVNMQPHFGIAGLGAIFYFFAVCSFITVVATFTLIPETKGLPVDEIQLKLINNRK